MISFSNNNSGFIKLTIIIIVALLVLAYFGLNLRSIVNSPTFEDNWNLIKEFISDIWNKYLSKPFDYIWNKVFVPLIWRPAINNLEKMRVDEPTSIQDTATQTPSLGQ